MLRRGAACTAFWVCAADVSCRIVLHMPISLSITSVRVKIDDYILLLGCRLLADKTFDRPHLNVVSWIGPGVMLLIEGLDLRSGKLRSWLLAS